MTSKTSGNGNDNPSQAPASRIDQLTSALAARDAELQKRVAELGALGQNAKRLMAAYEHTKNQLVKARADNEALRAAVSARQPCPPFNDTSTLHAPSTEKPVIRTIHHLACSGGSLISKCIGAMPNVFVLSEVHPRTTLHLNGAVPHFAPSDLLALSWYADIPDMDTLLKTVFLSDMTLIATHVAQRGGHLVVRDHAHSDFCVGEPLEQATVRGLLSDRFETVSLVTVRDPVDSFASLKLNDWVHFEPKTFDAYCGRVLGFLSSYPEVPILKYEAFVAQPRAEMRYATEVLGLPYTDTFEETYRRIRMTGDSGRKSDRIAPRQRRPLSDAYRDEIRCSPNYRLFCEQYGYDPRAR